MIDAILVGLGSTPALRGEELGEQPLDLVAQQRVEPPARTMIRPRRVK
jgi:hypothetical protein